MGSKKAPPPSNYMGLAQQQAQQSTASTNAQTAANRPNQLNPYGSTQWGVDANGNATQSSSFGGGLREANQAAQQSLADALKTPLQDGQQARDQAITAAYGQATSRLDPMWNQREAASRTRLLNQGLDPSSEASRAQTGQLGMARNDAYGSAMNAAIGQGREAGDSVFRNSLLSKQYPLQQLQGMQGLLTQSGFMGAGKPEDAQLLQAALAGDAAAMEQWKLKNQMISQNVGAGLGAAGQAGAAAILLSDERAKQNIDRHGPDVLPGVPLASWEYRHEPGVRRSGVIAQDLEKVAPQFVVKSSEGVRFVNYGALQRALR